MSKILLFLAWQGAAEPLHCTLPDQKLKLFAPFNLYYRKKTPLIINLSQRLYTFVG